MLDFLFEYVPVARASSALQFVYTEFSRWEVEAISYPCISGRRLSRDLHSQTVMFPNLDLSSKCFFCVLQSSLLELVRILAELVFFIEDL